MSFLGPFLIKDHFLSKEHSDRIFDYDTWYILEIVANCQNYNNIQVNLFKIRKLVSMRRAIRTSGITASELKLF